MEFLYTLIGLTEVLAIAVAAIGIPSCICVNKLCNSLEGTLEVCLLKDPWQIWKNSHGAE